MDQFTTLQFLHGQTIVYNICVLNIVIYTICELNLVIYTICELNLVIYIPHARLPTICNRFRFYSTLSEMLQIH